jgi:hypothetical protein
MSRAASPFSPRTLLAVLAVGAGAFLLLLYAIGAGWDGGRDQNGGAHAAANGLNGFSGLVHLLEEQGHDVSLSRSEARLDDEALLVLTPQHGADGEAIAQIIGARRYVGPTLLILPKWLALPADQVPGVEARPGWVMLGGTIEPEWLGSIDGLDEENPEIGESRLWHGFELSGQMPEPDKVMSLAGTGLATLVIENGGDTLVGYLDDAGHYPTLAAWAGFEPRAEDDPATDAELWPVIVVADPDLMNNYGLADRTRARLAHAIVDAALEDYELPIVFDLSTAGLARSENLLTLAFQPPFLAATLCLILAALVIAWRGFRRFGPPVAEAPALAMGKRQLARNGGGLVARARRLHLLGPPYAALVTARLAEALGVREADPQAREAAIARILSARGLAADYVERADALRRARRPAELLRAAGALRSIERTVTP